ncbi:MAG: hypothetical protein A2W31_15795 [Planctomycetes bacterium RBG_16_64_10]|nr:MAG: hypothetical protein A2W31_15795 [Planctomycetes bacterium RBG_16_64_10]
MLTEREVTRTWQRLLCGPEVSEECMSRAEALLEKLRPESPLRHRLSTELAEIRQLCEQRSGTAR